MIEPGYIDPDSLYDEPTIRLNLGITSGALQKARKAGELRFTRRGGKTRYFGRWLIAWLEGESCATPARQAEQCRGRPQGFQCQELAGVGAAS